MTWVAESPTVGVSPTGPSPTKVLDLMAALEASVKAAHTQEEKPTKARRSRSTGT
jgi:non-homologous end joining protein Ku